MAAILFPVFAKAREKARQSSCSSNAKQLMLAALQYVQDYDERFAQAQTRCAAGSTRESHRSVCTRIYPYAKNGQMFDCPSRSVDSCGGNGIAHHNINEEKADGSLPANFKLGLGFCEDNVVNGRKLGDYLRPAETVYLGDSPGYLNPLRLASSDQCPNSGTPCGTGLPANARSRHNNGSNAAFIDGHVKWLSQTNCLTVNIYP